MDLSPAQVLAFRLTAQGFGADDAEPLAALASWSVQDSPAGTAALALAARGARFEPGALDLALHEQRTAVALYNPRTATAIVPAAEVAAYTSALLPREQESLRFVLGRAIPPAGEGIGPADAVEAALPAFAAALDGRQLSRDDLHAALRERLPSDLLPWCDGCQSHHARRGLLVVAGLHGLLCIAGRAGRQPLFARTDQWIGPQAAPAVDPDVAAAELVRRHLSWCGPSTPRLFTQWAGIAPAQASAAWALVADELVEVSVDGGRAWLLTDDARGASCAGADGSAREALLLPPGDPLLLARDRELLLPDPAARRALFVAINPPGLVLLGGKPAALWRGRKRGRRLAVELRALGGASLTRRAIAAIEREAIGLAPHRGCASATVAVG
ncbi:crosslink repair DNA glycosylase YcaQ family protein [Conexibacter stalactiti]|uniref:Crosslink repair DNA glycosylase YcaQ family protein n=1 Tax=Conexibacter stalactiti TaxID=1940611 RepID=A0ABU4HTZ0_9ACTN|nr:crosslink repair DNA glycosylase YcaQ family protein [Conexibacter stalactiti]MDW5596741.1 crosslink repair DNA glycosylase YcaQ family protein [Conexibacter stalactiti]MEC5037383.1 crosslink repair DNA glycosylase YcaQ family protein [Conexibacter stalactiti]